MQIKANWDVIISAMGRPMSEKKWSLKNKSIEEESSAKKNSWDFILEVALFHFLLFLVDMDRSEEEILLESTTIENLFIH